MIEVIDSPEWRRAESEIGNGGDAQTRIHFPNSAIK